MITNYGGIITSIMAPDRKGVLENIVHGHGTLAEYEQDSRYLGALVGRYANRIAKSRFVIDGREHRVSANDGPNHLHGGLKGFDSVVWNAESAAGREGSSLLLKYLSKDGEEGYPGNLSLQVRYTLGDDDRLHISYSTNTDRTTPVNLTSHCYFNLSGDRSRSITSHLLQLNAAYFTPVDSTLIPTGEIRPVEGTPFDFRSLREIGAGIDADDEQIRFGGGYDHNFVLRAEPGGAPGFAARLAEVVSGRVMEVHTTEPGLQFYSGNFMGQGQDRTGLCLETQHFPDSPNQPGFPSTILRPGETRHSQTIYSFSA